jgi:integrative and conjugative element protein (TIGR02256 family)
MPGHMMYSHPRYPECLVLIEPHVVQTIFQHRQLRECDAEAGGILLGLRRGDHLHVTSLTCPSLRDKRSRFAFWRRRRHHQDEALKQWRASGGVVDYLGEWHTHPQTRPSPSGTDLREWRTLLRHYEDPLLFLIAGTLDFVWAGIGQGRHIEPAAALERNSEASHG